MRFRRLIEKSPLLLCLLCEPRSSTGPAEFLGVPAEVGIHPPNPRPEHFIFALRDTSASHVLLFGAPRGPDLAVSCRKPTKGFACDRRTIRCWGRSRRRPRMGAKRLEVHTHTPLCSINVPVGQDLVEVGFCLN